MNDEIEKELKAFLPDKASREWLESIAGSARWVYDEEALQKGVVEPITDFFSRGGKRWRQRLLILCCEAVGGKKEDAIKFSVIPELIHNGTLMIDDIEDNSELRRGKACTHKIFGNDVAINAGNILYYLPLVVVKNSDLDDKKKKEIYEIINDEMLKIGLGQGTDIYWHQGKKEPSEEEYLQMCANKTGVLARMAAKLGAIVGNGSEEQVEALGTFAESLGVAFQIMDDVRNITEDLGKGFGDDISEGKRSLVVIKTFEQAEEKERLREILNKQTKDEKEIQEAIGIIKKYNAIEYAKNKAKEIVNESWEKVTLDDSNAKKELKELVDSLT